MSEQLGKVVFMVNVNDFLTYEQIGMLINEISSNDMVVFFFMDDREKIDYLLNRKKVWSSSYDYYNKQFDAFSHESLLYKDSDKEKYLSCCESMHSLFLDMQHCTDIARIYDILLEHI